MILADTSIWVEYLKKGNSDFAQLIEERQIALHPFVYGELLLGGLPEDSRLKDDMAMMPAAPIAEIEEVNAFISWAGLAGTGIGYVDTHLLISARLMPRGTIWALDKKLMAQAEQLELAYR